METQVLAICFLIATDFHLAHFRWWAGPSSPDSDWLSSAVPHSCERWLQLSIEVWRLACGWVRNKNKLPWLSLTTTDMSMRNGKRYIQSVLFISVKIVLAVFHSSNLASHTPRLEGLQTLQVQPYRGANRGHSSWRCIHWAALRK